MTKLAWVPMSLLLLQFVQGNYEFHVRVSRYRNENHRDAQGCCDLFCGTCDNYFFLCLRPSRFSSRDQTCPNGQRLTGEVGGDHLTFTDVLGDIPNPVLFSVPGPWSGSFQLRIDVHDSDFFVDDFVDEVFAEPLSFPLGEAFSDPTWYTGVGRRSQIELSFKVVCSENFYGKDCNTQCVGSDIYSCDQNGNMVCMEGKFLPPECSVYCIPEDGRYQCDPENGERICEENYYPPMCEVQCIPHPTNYTCDPRNGAKICQEDYFTDECNVFCRNSSEDGVGFCTCDTVTGEKECLPDYIDVDTNSPTLSLNGTAEPISGATFGSDSKKSENLKKNYTLVIVVIVILLALIFVFSLLAAVVLAFRIITKRKPASQGLTQTLLNPEDTDNQQNFGKNDVTSAQEHKFKNPLYKDVDAPGQADAFSLTGDPLYSSVRSNIRANFVHL